MAEIYKVDVSTYPKVGTYGEYLILAATYDNMARGDDPGSDVISMNRMAELAEANPVFAERALQDQQTWGEN